MNTPYPNKLSFVNCRYLGSRIRSSASWWRNLAKSTCDPKMNRHSISSPSIRSQSIRENKTKCLKKRWLVLVENVALFPLNHSDHAYVTLSKMSNLFMALCKRMNPNSPQINLNCKMNNPICD